MKTNHKELKNYPDVMSKEQMRIVCHISKRTALYLLQLGLIPIIDLHLRKRVCRSIAFTAGLLFSRQGTAGDW